MTNDPCKEMFRAVLQNPKDIQARLVYCDALDESGIEENRCRTAWYRWSIAHPELTFADIEVEKLPSDVGCGMAIVMRNDVLACTYKTDPNNHQPTVDFTLTNGFCDYLVISPSGFCLNVESLFSTNPITRVRFIGQRVWRDWTDSTFRVYINNVESIQDISDGVGYSIYFPKSFGQFLKDGQPRDPYGDRDYLTADKANMEVQRAAIRWGRWKVGLDPYEEETK